VFGLLLILIIRFFSRCFRGFFRGGRPGGLLLVAPVRVPPPAVVPGAVPPVIPPLPGALALRGCGLLAGLLLRCLRWLHGILWLRIFFCHDCQTD
jgi:hypothetical protein